jgi:hypothetical protein
LNYEHMKIISNMDHLPPQKWAKSAWSAALDDEIIWIYWVNLRRNLFSHGVSNLDLWSALGTIRVRRWMKRTHCASLLSFSLTCRIASDSSKADRFRRGSVERDSRFLISLNSSSGIIPSPFSISHKWCLMGTHVTRFDQHWDLVEFKWWIQNGKITNQFLINWKRKS